jgi:hypothetical protein
MGEDGGLLASADVMAITKWSIGRNKQRPYAISLNESALSKKTKMPRKDTTAALQTPARA